MNPETLFEENQKLVLFTINRYFKAHIYNEDVFSAGNLGLWKACLNFKPEKGAFSTIAVRYIQGYIQHELLDHNNPFYTAPIETLYLQPHTECQFKTIEDEIFVEQFLGTLEPQEIKLCRLLLENLNKNEAGKQMGVSHTTIDNRLKKIQGKYERYMKRRRNAKVYINHLRSINPKHTTNPSNSNLPTILQP